MWKMSKKTRVIVSGSLLILALVFYLIGLPNWLRDLTLVTVSIVAGHPIAKKALQAALLKLFSIELLVTIAVVGALIIGEYVEAGAVTFLFLVGGYLEARTLARARASLRNLLEMSPSVANVSRNGEIVEIPAELVKKNDMVIVRSGEKIPVDGKIQSGNGQIIEAAITGESIPVTKEYGDEVYGGTVLDQGYLEIIAEKVGEDTTFARILDMVEEAQESKAKIQKFLERFASFYTPGILILSVVVWLFTYDFHLTLTFLVIACPGALVISAPVSLVAGIGNAATKGILIKGGDKMENLARVNGMVFDKTGTLTRGEPEVTDIKSFGMKREELLQLAMEVEVASEHHLGRAILREAKNLKIKLKNKAKNINILKGQGIVAEIENKLVFIGNKKGWENRNINLSIEIDHYISEQEKLGHTVVLVALDDQPVGVISFADQIRPEAYSALARLRKMGVKHTVMLTGDNPLAAKKVADALGIGNVYAQLLPEDKVRKVQACMKEGVTLAMVGDGINDAPAIATADVGIAMGGVGSDIALETADVILMSDRLDKLAYAFELAKATVRNMKQNMYFSVGVVLLLLAGVLTGNVFLASGMLIHEASVLLVILNALRLVRFREKPHTSRLELSQKEKTEVQCSVAA